MTDGVKKIKKTLHRSPAYPSIDLQKAIPLAEKLFKKFSDDSFSRPNAVEELGLQKTGPSFRKVAALVHFGLIVRKGSNYKVSDLTKHIIYPGDEVSISQTAIKKAAMNPTLYQGLVQTYRGKALPEALHHTLISQHKFNQSVAEKVSKDFKQTLEFAGLLRNGLVTVFEDEGEMSDQAPDTEEMVTRDKSNSPIKGKGYVEKTVVEGIAISLGKDITVSFSHALLRDVAKGKFAKVLEDLEKLGKECNGEDISEGNAPNAAMEQN